MATVSVHIPHVARFGAWFPDFLRKELAPYPGRGLVVARIIVSATLTMILIITFRIPGGVIGALCAFLLSRENLVATARSALYLILAFILGALFIPIGARLLASTPETHFVWVACSLFLVFFLLRTLSNYAIAIGLALVVSNVVAIWYLPGPASLNVELTLWQLAATFIGALVTLGVEFAFFFFHGQDTVLEGLDSRLEFIENQMESYASGQPIPPETASKLAQFAIVGAGSLRRHLERGNYEPLLRVRMSTLVSLTGRSVDFAAAMANAVPTIPVQLHDRVVQLRRSIADIRSCLRTHGQPCETALQPQPTSATPLLTELETMVSLMPAVFTKETLADPELEPVDDAPSPNRIFIADAFSNPEHLRYILGGTVAAMMCYIFYVALAWPNLSTSVTTCVLTALTTIGTSRQKQLLRVAGFVLGGIIFGLGAQICVLPYIDSITGFTVLFATSTAIAAWIATSSSRLSYAGVQFAFAFYLIHLSDFTIQVHLTIARDRALGVLLGISMMWLIFERLSPRSAADEMIRIFLSNLRLMAELVETPPCAGNREAILKIRRRRDQVYRHFGDVTAQSDAVPFETGPSRARDLAARDRIRRWQASLRSFYLLDAPLLQFRAFGDASQKSKPFTELEDRFRTECAQALLRIAESLENQLQKKPFEGFRGNNLTAELDSSDAGGEGISEREQALLRLSRNIAQIIDRLQTEVASEPLYETP
jgi:multidrug resistance protein MdtO